jgi:hypothetical protein
MALSAASISHRAASTGHSAQQRSSRSALAAQPAPQPAWNALPAACAVRVAPETFPTAAAHAATSVPVPVSSRPRPGPAGGRAGAGQPPGGPPAAARCVLGSRSSAGRDAVLHEPSTARAGSLVRVCVWGVKLARQRRSSPALAPDAAAAGRPAEAALPAGRPHPQQVRRKLRMRPLRRYIHWFKWEGRWFQRWQLQQERQQLRQGGEQGQVRGLPACVRPGWEPAPAAQQQRQQQGRSSSAAAGHG